MRPRQHEAAIAIAWNNANAQKGHVEMGEDGCHDIIKDGNRPDAVTQGSMLTARAEKDEFKRAEYCLREMER